MAFVRRFIAESELSALRLCVWSTGEGDDSRSQPGPTTCWGNPPTSGRTGSQAKTDRTPTTLNWRSHMTLIKSILLGSAAGLVAVASAQAADLPTRKAAPVEYVRVCNVGGITGWTMPGSDTCVKISGYMTGHFIGGNINNQFNSAGSVPGLATIADTLNPNTPKGAGQSPHFDQVLLVEGGNAAPPGTPTFK